MTGMIILTVVVTGLIGGVTAGYIIFVNKAHAREAAERERQRRS